MKKTLLACLSLAAGLFLCSCSNAQEPEDAVETITGALECAPVSDYDGEFTKIHFYAEGTSDDVYYVWCDADMASVEILRVAYQDEIGLFEQEKLSAFDAVRTGEAIQLNIDIPEGTPNLAIRYEANGAVRTYVPAYNGVDGSVYMTEADIAPAQSEDGNSTDAESEADANENGGTNADASTPDSEGFECIIYYVNDNADALVRNETTIESSSAWHMWAALKRANPSIPLSAGLHSYTVAQGVGFLDVETDIYTMNAGSGVEGLLLQAIANTYIENTDAESVMIRVDGEMYESGHIVLDEPISFREL